MCATRPKKLAVGMHDNLVLPYRGLVVRAGCDHAIIVTATGSASRSAKRHRRSSDVVKTQPDKEPSIGKHRRRPSSVVKTPTDKEPSVNGIEAPQILSKHGQSLKNIHRQTSSLPPRCYPNTDRQRVRAVSRACTHDAVIGAHPPAPL